MAAWNKTNIAYSLRPLKTEKTEMVFPVVRYFYVPSDRAFGRIEKKYTVFEFEKRWLLKMKKNGSLTFKINWINF